jgi:hypothetical protein
MKILPIHNKTNVFKQSLIFLDNVLIPSELLMSPIFFANFSNILLMQNSFDNFFASIRVHDGGQVFDVACSINLILSSLQRVYAHPFYANLGLSVLLGRAERRLTRH